MTEHLFLYSVRSAFVLALLYIPYMLLLRKERLFRLNRLVLLLILLLSLVLPALDIHHLAWEGFAPVQMPLRPLPAGGDAQQPTPVVLSEVTVRPHADMAVSLSPWQWLSILFVVVMAGVALWHVFQVMRMGVAVRRGSLWHQTRDGVHIYCHADEVPPYSWMGSVVISERDYHENGREILLHETAHIRARHSWDLLFLALVQTLQWWNPLVYILGVSLRDVHEYQADDSVLRHGVSARAYQLLLIKKVVGSGSYAFANNFDHSLIIKRITMMQKSKPSKWMCGKALYILPVATLALSAFATAGPSRSTANAGDKVSTLTLNGQAKAQESAATALQSADSTLQSIKASADYCENPAVKPHFPGEDHAIWEFIGRSVRYPDVALKNGVQGIVIVDFLVGKDGTISDVHVMIGKNRKKEHTATTLRGVMMTASSKEIPAGAKGQTGDDEAANQAGVDAIKAEAVRMVKSMPKWVPGYKDKAKTQPCITPMRIPVTFRLN